MEVHLRSPSSNLEPERFLAEHFPQAAHMNLRIEHLDPHTIRVRVPTEDRHLRPGGTVSGPTLVWLANLAALVCPTLSGRGPASRS